MCQIQRNISKMAIWKMETIHIVAVVTFALTAQFAEIKSHDECASVQYLYLNDSGIIECSFEDYVAVTWFNSDEEKTILLLHDGFKSGDGYVSGQYDIFANGSLIIQHVTLEHDALFKVSKVISVAEALLIQYDIQVITMVKPQTFHPVIDNCPEGTTFCLIPVYFDGFLNCVVENSRPPVHLTWMSRSSKHDEVLDSSYTCTTYDNITYTSQSRVEYVMSQLSLLNTFVCQANNNSRNLIVEQESLIVLDKVMNYKAIASPQKRHFEADSSLKLPCSSNSINSSKYDMIVWKQSPKGQETWSSIGFTSSSSTSHNYFTELYKPEFKIDGEGTLFLEALKSGQEGMYICIYKNGQKQDFFLNDVNVYVNPIPPYPVVEGCNYQGLCVLDVAEGDVMKCSIIGIRPEVELEWMVLGSTGTVSFDDKRVLVKQNKDLFDVTLTSRISLSPSFEKGVTIECRVIGSENHQFQFSTLIELRWKIATGTNQPSHRKVIIIVCAVVFFMMFVITILLLLRGKANRRKRKQRARESDQEEFYPMMPNIPEDIQPIGDTSATHTDRPIKNKKDDFIEQLKGKYEMLYDSVQPIPYIKDRMFGVNKVFVESDIKYLVKSADPRQKGNWKPLKSYHELLSESMTSSDRSIIEGDPGYGKSTITLQLAYDWCNSVKASPLSSIKMLLFLRLRQLGGVSSIYQAIRRFILPKDSTLTEEDVKEIIEACNSVLILLDGYDEYPDQDNKETDISKIISKDIFRKTKVVLTTRSSYLPKHRAPQCSRIRLLGFDESARDKYIRKAVVGDDEVSAVSVKHKLQENPILGDLCEVPLLFVMFAHITHEHKELRTFKSVTEFFRYMITCFHSHMRNKMEDENVKVFQLMEQKHSCLDEIAFKALTGNYQQTVWSRAQLIKSLGSTFYDQYVKVGILVEDEIVNSPGKFYSQSDLTVEVRFYHKLFCEWYGAHYLAQCISDRTMDPSHLLTGIDPHDLEYLLRFACGISKDAFEEIVKHLQKTEEGKKLIILCVKEQESAANGFLEHVTKLVSSKVTVSERDSRLLQRSTLRILECASMEQIPIPNVTLHQSFDKVDKDVIVLTSGLILSQLLTLKKMHIETEEQRELTKDDFIKCCTFALRSTMIEEISFGGCLLPLSFVAMSVLNRIMDRGVKVTWCRYGYRLNSQSGLWEIDDISIITRLCSSNVTIRTTDSKSLQRCTIHFLKNASINDIPIPSVILNRSFLKADKNEIKLISGVILPSLSTLEKLQINTKTKQVLTEDEITKICKYALQLSKLEELSFGGCLLPLSFPKSYITDEIIKSNIKVTWNRYGYQLNFSSRLWEVNDVRTVERLCSRTVTITNTDSELLQRCTVKLLKNASDYKIHITCVWLKKCLAKGIMSDLSILLDSGVSLPILHSLRDLTIEDTDILNHEGFAAFVRYASECRCLKELWFRDGYTLPETVPRKLIPSALISRNVKVLHNKGPLGYFILKFDTGEWERY